MAVFDTDANDRPDDFVAALVGEDKKFKTVEDLAKGKWESDNYIASLKTELDQLKSDLQSRESIEALLKERLKQPEPQTRTPEAHQPAPTSDKPMSKEDLAQLFREFSNEEQKTRQVSNNRDEVASKLTQLYGSEDKAAQVVRTRAQELGVSVQFLQSVAEQSPKAFFAQLGVAPEAKPTSSGPTRGDVNPTAFGTTAQSKERTYAWYQEIRKADPKAYNRLASQMHEDALKMGDAFFN